MATLFCGKYPPWLWMASFAVESPAFPAGMTSEELRDSFSY
ncbi:MAG: hypothetical protein ACREPT_11050 [Rudaea sp.]